MYGGRTSEKWATTRAVNLTKGKVLALNSYLIPSYYHATCGGHTEDASNLWNINLPCLKGVACDFCKSSPHYKWTKEISPIALEDKLKDGGYKIGKVVSVVVLSKNGSGRVDKLEIKDDAGASVVLTGKDFRQLMGPNELRSTKFEASLKWNNLVLNGFGWGHGVGMCQWGAFGLARKGKKAEEILAYYYPGIEVTTLDKLKK
jgi:stage II sporulation protein D